MSEEMNYWQVIEIGPVIRPGVKGTSHDSSTVHRSEQNQDGTDLTLHCLSCLAEILQSQILLSKGTSFLRT